MADNEEWVDITDSYAPSEEWVDITDSYSQPQDNGFWSNLGNTIVEGGDLAGQYLERAAGGLSEQFSQGLRNASSLSDYLPQSLRGFQAAFDELGLSDYLSSKGQGLRQDANADIQDIVQQSQLPAGSNWETARNIGAGVGAAAPIIGGALLTKSPLVAAELGGLFSVGNKTADLLDQGVPIQDTTLPATGQGAIDLGLNYIPVSRALKPLLGDSTRIGRAIAAGTEGALGNVLSEGSSMGIDYAMTGNEPVDVTSRLGVAALTGGTMAGTLGAIAPSGRLPELDTTQVDNALSEAINSPEPLMIGYDPTASNSNNVIELPASYQEPINIIDNRSEFNDINLIGENLRASAKIARATEIANKQAATIQSKSQLQSFPEPLASNVKAKVEYNIPEDVIFDRANEAGVLPTEQLPTGVLVDEFGKPLPQSDIPITRGQFPLDAQPIDTTQVPQVGDPFNRLSTPLDTPQLPRVTKKEGRKLPNYVYEQPQRVQERQALISDPRGTAYPPAPERGVTGEGSASQILLSKAMQDAEIVRQNEAPKVDTTAQATMPESPVVNKPTVEVNAQPKKVKPTDPNQMSFFDLLKSEKGAVSIHADIANGASKAIDEYWRNPALIDEAKSEKFLTGTIADRRVPVVSDALGGFHNQMSFMSTIAEKFPKFAPIYEAGKNLLKRDIAIHASMVEAAKDYYEASPDAARLAAEFRDRAYVKGLNKTQITPQLLANAGLNDEAIKAYYALDNSLQKSLDLIVQTQVKGLQENGVMAPETKAQKLQLIMEKYQALSSLPYMPHSRFGKLQLTVLKDGQPVSTEYFDSQKDLAIAKRQYEKQGFTIDTSKRTTPYEMTDASAGGYDKSTIFLQPNLATPVGGWRGHLMENNNYPGYSKDWDRVIADYFGGLGKYVAREDAKIDFKRGIDSLREPNATRNEVIEDALYKKAKRYAEFMISDTGNWSSKFNQLMAYKYLGYNLRSAIINGTQTMTTSAPMATKYLTQLGESFASGKGMRLLKNSAQQATIPISKMLKSSNPEIRQLAIALDKAVKEGDINLSLSRQLMDKARGKSASRYVDPMLLFSAVETFNRKTSFIMGWELGKKMKLQGDALFNFADKFVADTQFDQSRANLPEVAWNGIGRSALLFRLYQGHMLRFFRNLSGEKGGGKALLQSLSTLAGLGGVKALPGAAILFSGLTAAGYDPAMQVRNLFATKEDDNKDYADAFLYGVPMPALGVNLSGSMSFESPDFEAKPETILAKTLGGVPGAAISDAIKAGSYLADGNYRGTVETMMPESFRNILTAQRADADNAFRTLSTNKPKVTNPTLGEKILKGIGLMPSRLASANEQARREYNQDKRLDNVTKRFNRDLAESIYKKDKDAVAQVIAEIQDYNANADPADRYEPKSQFIKRYIIEQIAPEYASLKGQRKQTRARTIEQRRLTLGER